MRYFLTAISINLVTISQLLFAQAPDTMWTKKFGGNEIDTGGSVRQTADGGYIITGATYSFGAGLADFWLIKTDTNGDTLWTKTYGGNSDDRGGTVQQTSDGGYIISGYTSSFGAGSNDVWLIKTDTNGDTLWTKTYGGNSDDRGGSVQQTSDGGYIVAGWTYPFGDGKRYVWLIKTDASGDTLWTKTFGDTSQGGVCGSVQQTSDGGFIVVGETRSYSGGSNDLWLIKTDTTGDTIWTKTYGGEYSSAGFSVQQTSDGGYIITGGKNRVLNPWYFEYVWLIKTDTNGDTLWTKTFGNCASPQFCYNWGSFVQQTSDGGYIIVGTTVSSSRDLWIIKTDTNGDTMWTKLLGQGGQEDGNSVQQTRDGGYIIAGVTDRDAWLIKLAPDMTSIDGTALTSINDYHLKQNYPNPFNPTTTIEFDLPKTGEVSLKVFNILGEEVATLVSGRLSAGSYSYEWDASNLASGVYLYRLQAGDYVETIIMILMK